MTVSLRYITLLLFLNVVYFFSHAQDSIQIIRKIDSLTKTIDFSVLQLQIDSNERTTYMGQFTMIAKEYKYWYYDDQQNLKKLIWDNQTKTFDEKDTANAGSLGIFYYEDDRLVKLGQVTDNVTGKSKKIECYFANDRLISCSVPFNNENGADKEEIAKRLSQLFLKQFNERKNKRPVTTPPPSRSS